MSLDDDREVELHAQLGRALQAVPHPEPLDAADVRRAPGRPAGFQPVQQLIQASCIELREDEPEAVLHLALPLVDKHAGADHEDAVGLQARFHLRPHQARLDRLTQTYLIRDQQAEGSGVEQLLDGLELIRPEDRPCRAEGEHGVGEVT